MTNLVDSLQLKHRDKVSIHFNQTVTREAFAQASKQEKERMLNEDTEKSAGEVATIQAVQRYCRRKADKGEKAIVYYFHSKSGCCYKHPFNSVEKNPRSSWRSLMNAFNLEFPSICLRAILKGYNTCGVENQDAHYSGNFWWADCEHINALQAPQNRFDAWSAEFFVQRYSVDFGLAKKIGFHCGYSMYNCGVNLYVTDCRRESFRDRLFKLVMSNKWPASYRGTAHTNDTARCQLIRAPGTPAYDANQVAVRNAFKDIPNEDFQIPKHWEKLSSVQ
mmetsp:Transcript_20410/g.34181  ORF Transcript_20410/g.34181 Transcript_20410/m.34181 type:complete len:277 (+) Transcript_20410:401-1231(+)